MQNRSWAAEELKSLGFTLTDSKANFLFAKHPGIPGKALYQALKDRGILVRHFDTQLLTDFNRITVGSRQQMEILIGAIRSILEESL
jgi:histidinol-phosphate aminotransferase